MYEPSDALLRTVSEQMEPEKFDEATGPMPEDVNIGDLVTKLRISGERIGYMECESKLLVVLSKAVSMAPTRDRMAGISWLNCVDFIRREMGL